jgi:hypothetical protein
MFALAIFVVLCFSGFVRSSGIAVIQPTMLVRCGTTIAVPVYPTENGLFSGSDKIRVSLFTQTSVPLLRKTTLVAMLGEMPFDAGVFNFTFPDQIPAGWLTSLKKINPDSKIYRVFLKAEKVGNSDVDSEPGLFDAQLDFLLECCKTGETQCDCSAVLPTCIEPGAFCLSGRCASGAPPDGALNGKCRPAAPRCDEGAVCSLSDGKCIGDNLSCPAGTEGCACNGNTCNKPSLRCAERNTCEAFAPTTADLLGAACNVGDQSACFTSLTVPLSCKEGKCAQCTPGETHCVCKAGDVCDGGVSCEYGRCGGIGSARGCLKCPCVDGLRCNGGPSFLACNFGRCEPPGKNPRCGGGGLGCECITSPTGQTGCTQRGLVCGADMLCVPGAVVASTTAAGSVETTRNTLQGSKTPPPSSTTALTVATAVAVAAVAALC